MTFIDDVKNKIDDLAGTARDHVAAHHEKAESDTAADPHVAGSRAGGSDADEDYVGRTTQDVDADAGQSGAEARSEQARGREA